MCCRSSTQLRWSINVQCRIIKIILEFYEDALTGSLQLELQKDIMSDFLKDLSLNDHESIYCSNATASLCIRHQLSICTFQTYSCNQKSGMMVTQKKLPSSPAMNPWTFVLWRYIKQKMYATPTLRNRIMDSFARMSPAMLRSVQWEVQSLAQMCIVLGHHLKHNSQISPISGKGSLIHHDKKMRFMYF